MSSSSYDKGQELIEKLAKIIVDNDLDFLTNIFLEGTLPAGEFIGQIGYIFVFPWIFGFFGDRGKEFMDMFALNYNKNVSILLERVSELRKEKEKLKKKNSNVNWILKKLSFFKKFKR